MTISSTPWDHPEPKLSQLHLDVVPEGVLHALADGATASLPLQYVSPYLAGSECLGLWRMRSMQIRNTPTDAPWVTRFIVDPDVTVPVGIAGFHGAPDDTGMVEVGYRVDPGHRRRGYARRSLETLLAVAKRHPTVHVVRATIAPNNAVSRRLVGRYGFVEVGEQWDDEDGLEIVYEAAASAVRSS